MALLVAWRCNCCECEFVKVLSSRSCRILGPWKRPSWHTTREELSEAILVVLHRLSMHTAEAATAFRQGPQLYPVGVKIEVSSAVSAVSPSNFSRPGVLAHAEPLYFASRHQGTANRSVVIVGHLPKRHHLIISHHHPITRWGARQFVRAPTSWWESTLL